MRLGLAFLGAVSLSAHVGDWKCEGSRLLSASIRWASEMYEKGSLVSIGVVATSGTFGRSRIPGEYYLHEGYADKRVGADEWERVHLYAIVGKKGGLWIRLESNLRIGHKSNVETARCVRR